MLADSRLLHRFWAEALFTAAYLINRSPTKTLGDKTPFEAWYGKKPNVNHLQVFGCSAYIHIPKDERSPKPRSAFSCGTVPQGRATVFMTRRHQVSSMVMMLSSMNPQGDMDVKRRNVSSK